MTNHGEKVKFERHQLVALNQHKTEFQKIKVIEYKWLMRLSECWLNFDGKKMNRKFALQALMVCS